MYEKIAFFKCKKQKTKYGDKEQDGGVTKKVVTNAPKHIQSTLIIRFTVEMSTVADTEENEYCGYVYNLNAVLENGAVKGIYKCRDRYGSGDMFAEGYLVSKGEEYSFDENFVCRQRQLMPLTV